MVFLYSLNPLLGCIHYVYHRGGGGGVGGRGFLMGILNFLARDKGGLPKFLTEETGVADLFFSSY